MDQRIALQILGKLVRSFESNLLEEYLNVVKVHVHHQDIEVRRILLDIFSKQYLESGDDNIKELSLSVLMVGLNDKKPTIRISMTEFFTNIDILPRHSFEHIKMLLSRFYHPEHEDTFVSHFPALLLITCYKKLMFSDPPEQCKFLEHILDTSWHQHVSTMIPMFAETLTNQSQAIDSQASQASQTKE